MRKTANDLERQLATASEAADQYRDALSALAKSETEALKDMTPEMRRQMEVAKDDTYNLYLAYYFGWTGYENGAWKEKAGLQRYAQETEQTARDYARQLRKCDQAA